jgi:hypothetical protein
MCGRWCLLEPRRQREIFAKSLESLFSVSLLCDLGHS